VPPTRLGLHL